VSGDRLRREFEKLFADADAGQSPATALRLLSDWHVLGALEPGLLLPRSAAAPLRRLGKALSELPWPAGRLRPWVAGLAVWLAEVDPTLRRRTLRRLAVRGEAAERVAEFPKRRERWLRELARAHGRGAVDRVLSPLDEESLLALWCHAPPIQRTRIARWARDDRSRRPPLTGGDLVAAGFAGPAIGSALARARAAWLDGTVRTRAEVVALAREVAARETSRAGRRRRVRGCPPRSDRA
jgi:hypothetical protein